MIIVWDNGHDYSDHAIYFIDTLDYDVSDCLKLLKASNPEGFLVAKAHKIEWFEGGAAPVDGFVSFWSLDRNNRQVIYDIKPETLKGFYVKWKEFEEDLLRRAGESGRGKWYENVKQRYDTQFKVLMDYCEGL